jgi:selenocysteine lyase/cysteine desulfurase
MSYRSDFDLDDSRIWLNSSHQSALPRVAAKAAAEAVRWKLHPWEMTTERFGGVPRRLREVIGRVAGVEADDVILANGASFGLHLLANGLPLDPGDEVVVMAGDFPSNILPWLMLRERGVVVHVVKPRSVVLEADEVDDVLTPRTRVVCLSWVHSFSGHALDIDRIGSVCRKAGVWFIANTTQALGARRLDLASAPVDAVVNSGWKWLCGPYATGFAWIRPALVARMRRTQAYWLSMQTADDLARPGEVRVPDRIDPRHLDVFGTANFFNFNPFLAALTYLETQGLANIETRVQALVSRIVGGLDPTDYRLVSPSEGPRRSSLVVLSHQDGARTPAVHQALLDAGIVTALRHGNIRVAPHLYNLESEIDRLLEVLSGAARAV